MLYIDHVGHLSPSQKCLNNSNWLFPSVLVMEEGIKTYSAFPTLLVSPSNLQSSIAPKLSLGLMSTAGIGVTDKK